MLAIFNILLILTSPNVSCDTDALDMPIIDVRSETEALDAGGG